MLELGIRLHDIKGESMEERAEAAAGKGFECVHIALSKLPGQTAAPYALTPGYAAYIRKIFEKNNLDIALLGCYLNLAHPDADKLKSIQESYFAHIRFATMLGFPVVGTETGAPNPEYRYDRESCHSEEALELFIKNFRPVVECAEKFGVTVAIEPVYRHIVWNAKRARKVLDEINSPNLKIILDAVNLLAPENFERRDEVIDEAIELLGDDTVLLHLKNLVITGDTIEWRACKRGDLSYERLLRFAAEKKPHIQATFETIGLELADESVSYIRDVYNSVLCRE